MQPCRAKMLLLTIPLVCGFATVSFFSVNALGSTLSPVERAEIKVSRADQNEQFDRDVDEVALSAQEKAISKLQLLLKKYLNTSREPELLSKLADFQSQSAAILFRISHGKPQNLNRYQRVMEQAINSYSRLISTYPSYEELAHAYFARGKSYEDLERKELAAKDYLYLVKTYPNSDETPSAYMALAEFSIQANNHPQAILYLKEVEKRPESPHFPFALYKLAWSFYNLKEIPTALTYAERQIKYYSTEETASESEATNPVSSDTALRENTLLDIPVFFFEGYESKGSAYSLDQALPYFKQIASIDKGAKKSFGKMLARFSKLLRSHDHESDLLVWKNQVLASESSTPESLDVVLVTYEHQLNKRHYKEVTASAQDMVKLYQIGKNYESFPRAQKMILDTAEGLQALVLKNKAADEVRVYSGYLASIYESFTKMVDEADPRIPRVHYNLAETLFAIKEFGGATDHYRWIVDHGKWEKSKKDQPASVADASLKAIASRYEILRQMKLIPSELHPKAIQKATPAKLEPLLAQWITWVDTHESHRPEQVDQFLFESYRAQYDQGYVADILPKLYDLILRNPKSTFAVPAASLMLDTHVTSQDWEQTLKLASNLLKIKEWKGGEFSKRVFTVAADASYKKVEILSKAGEYLATLKSVDHFIEEFPSSARVADALILAGGLALAKNDKAVANNYYSRLINTAKNNSASGSSGTTVSGGYMDPANLRTAFLARAHMAEENDEFETAARDYLAYFKVGKGSPNEADQRSIDELKVKTLALLWLSDRPSELQAALAQEPQGICNDRITTQCDRYQALHALGAISSTGGSLQADEAFTQRAFEWAHYGKRNGSHELNKETRTLWAIAALDGAKHLAFRDRNLMLKAVGGGWNELDPLARFTLMPRLVRIIPRAFDLNRVAMKDVAPLRASEAYITHRVDSIREMENAATQCLKLPWARIRAEITNSVAGLYIDLARGLSNLNPPKNLSDPELASYQETIRKLVMPFEEKGQELRGKAFEIASRFAIEDSSFAQVAEPFFAENPSQAKKLRSIASAGAPPLLNLEFLTRIDPLGKWLSASSPSELGSHWASALQKGNWPQVAYFLQKAQEKKSLATGRLAIIKAISLASVGAQGEALTEIDENRSELSPEEWMVATGTLAQFYSRAYAHTRVEAMNREIATVKEKLAAQKRKNETAQK